MLLGRRWKKRTNAHIDDNKDRDAKVNLTHESFLHAFAFLVPAELSVISVQGVLRLATRELRVLDIILPEFDVVLDRRRTRHGRVV
jgi:hypothetical protein